VFTQSACDLNNTQQISSQVMASKQKCCTYWFVRCDQSTIC